LHREQQCQRARESGLNPVAISQKNNGGLSAYGCPPTRGNNQSPVATMSRATSAKRGSSAGQGSRKPMPVAISNSANPSSHRRSTHGD
jgi:hypothetical protein